MDLPGKINVKEAILRFLDEHHTMTVATAKDNMPYAASLFYANDGFDLYFISNSTSQHSSNLYLNPNVAITINKDYSMWRGIRGLQIWGRACPVFKARLTVAKEVYSGKYPFLESILGDVSFSSKFADVRFSSVIPERIRLINNEVAFGCKVEIEVE